MDEDNGFDFETLDSAEQVDVVDPQEADTEETQDTPDVGETEAQDEGSKEQDPADPAPAQNTTQTPQPKEQNDQFAAARRQAEAEKRAAIDRADAAARAVGFRDVAHMEQWAVEQRYTNAGYTQEQAQRMAELETENQRLKAEQAQTAEREKSQAAWVKVMQAYPETADPKFKMPQDVLDAVDAGETPLNAFNAYEVKRLRAQATAEKQNTETKQKAIGSLKGAAQPKTKADPFLDGLGG